MLGRGCDVVLGRGCAEAPERGAVVVLRSERGLDGACCAAALGRSPPPCAPGRRPCAEAGAARAKIATESAKLDNV